MSFFNFGPSPTKSSGQGQQSSSSDFNMFGAESLGQMFEGKGGCFFGGNGESGGSMFSGEVEDITPPLKKQRLEASNPRTNQNSGVHMSADHNSTANPLTQNFMKKASDTNVHGHGALSSAEPNVTFEHPQHNRENPDQTKGSAVFYDSTTAPAKVQAKLSSVQNSVMEQEMPKILAPGKEGGDFKPTDQIFKDLLNKQWQQLSEFLPELKASDEMSEEVLDNAKLVLKEVDEYSEKLAGIKQQYCTRLSQVSRILKMVPKHEK